jgi:hypothetical protein
VQKAKKMIRRALFFLVCLYGVAMAEGEDGQAVGDEAVGDGGGGAAVSEEEPDEAPVLTPEQKKRQEEFRELFWKYLGKNLSPDCARRLQELLQGSPEARKKGEPEFQTTCGEEMQKVRECGVAQLAQLLYPLQHSSRRG